MEGFRGGNFLPASQRLFLPAAAGGGQIIGPGFVLRPSVALAEEGL